MLIVTTNDLPGYQVTEVFGEVFGLTVRSFNIASQIGAVFNAALVVATHRSSRVHRLAIFAPGVAPPC